uniref:Fibronectin type-III domain-containing protein n=1 Tax=Paramormyrops kingsleyae TaxID=1676925 RepID=A0A3B3QDY4_9TELE
MFCTCPYISDVPEAPQNVSVGNVNRYGATVSWEPPESDGGSEITDYVIEFRDRTSVRWEVALVTKAKDCSAVLSDVIENKEYIFRVKSESVVARNTFILPKIDLSAIPQKSISLLAGKPIELCLPIIGRPPPVCSWYFGDVKLKIHKRVKIESTGKYSKLTVSNTTIDDTGDYTLELNNAMGSASEIIKVIILGENEI